MLAATAIAAFAAAGCGGGQRTSSSEASPASRAGRSPAPATAPAAAEPAKAPAQAARPPSHPPSRTPRAAKAAVSAASAPPPAPVATAAAAAPVAPVAPVATAAPGPQILSVATSPGIVHGGEHAVWDVRTSPDVVSVTATVDAYTLTLVRRAAGRFGLDFAVPANVPGFFHGTYNLQIVARNESGASVARTVTVVFQ